MVRFDGKIFVMRTIRKTVMLTVLGFGKFCNTRDVDFLMIGVLVVFGTSHKKFC